MGYGSYLSAQYADASTSAGGPSGRVLLSSATIPSTSTESAKDRGTMLTTLASVTRALNPLAPMASLGPMYADSPHLEYFKFFLLPGCLIFFLLPLPLFSLLLNFLNLFINQIFLNVRYLDYWNHHLCNKLRDH